MLVLETKAQEIIQHVRKTVELIRNYLPEKRPGDGYLCILRELEGHDAEVVLCAPVAVTGELPPGKWARYRTNAMEKAQRLHVLPTHRTSWESHSVKYGRFGGATRWEKFITSYSGLPQEGDEASMWILNARFLHMPATNVIRDIASPPVRDMFYELARVKEFHLLLQPA